MSNIFKAGDRVVRTRHLHQDQRNGGPDFVEGKVYTVKEARGYGGWLTLEEMPYRGSCGAYDPSCFRLAAYHEYFTEQQAKTPLLLGHVADSPIQKHSIGDFYPLAVVGYGNGDKVLYTVENITEGSVAAYGLAGDYTPRQWWHSELAAKWMAENTRYNTWIKQRPVFEDGFLALPKPATRKVVKLVKQDDIITINGAYKALEQDIG